MDLAVGQKVWTTWVNLENNGRASAYVSQLVVIAIHEGKPVFSAVGGGVRLVHASIGETLHETESDAWADAARQMLERRARLDASIRAAAAGASLGEAVPS
jgi:hypothetical protein